MGEISRRSMLTGVVGGAAGGLVVASAGSAEASTYPTLKAGMSGFYVQLLQNRLSRAGYWLGEPNGYFGALTQQAVWALQKAAGISRDGVVGPTTWRYVNAGFRPTPRTTAGTVIEINIYRQLLLVVRNGQLVLQLNTSTGSGEWYTSSSGSPAQAITPRGRFDVKWAVNGYDEGKLGRLYRPRYFTYGGVAVHGAASIPPYPASHGCARVHNAAMDMIWARNYMPLGSWVWVY